MDSRSRKRRRTASGEASVKPSTDIDDLYQKRVHYESSSSSSMVDDGQQCRDDTNDTSVYDFDYDQELTSLTASVNQSSSSSSCSNQADSILADDFLFQQLSHVNTSSIPTIQSTHPLHSTSITPSLSSNQNPLDDLPFKIDIPSSPPLHRDLQHDLNHDLNQQYFSNVPFIEQSPNLNPIPFPSTQQDQPSQQDDLPQSSNESFIQSLRSRYYPSGLTLWRESLIGQALVETLSELQCENYLFESESSKSILEVFDEVVTNKLGSLTPSTHFKIISGCISQYKNLDGSWVFYISDFQVRDRRRTFQSPFLRLVATETETLKRALVELQRRKKKQQAQFTTQQLFGEQS